MTTKSWLPDHEMQCVLFLGVGFMLIYGAYDAQQFVVEMSLRSIVKHSPWSNIQPFDGYYASSLGLFVLMLSVMIAPIIISRIGSKLSMALGSLAFTLFFVAFQSFDRNLLFLTSAIQGLGAALLWTGQGAYMKEITTQKRAERNNGVFSATMLISLIFAGTLLLIGFRSAGDTTTVSVQSVRYSYFTMGGLSVASNIVFLLLPQSETLMEHAKDPKKVTILHELATVCYLFKNAAFVIQIIAYLFIGAETAFILIVFPASLAFTEQLPFASKGILLASYAYANGVAQIATGFIIGLISKRSDFAGRLTSIVLGTVAQLVAFALICMLLPFKANFAPTNTVSYLQPSIWLAIATIALLAVGDCALKIAKGSILTTAFSPEQTTNAVALGLLLQAIGGCIFTFASSKIALHYHLVLFAGLLLLTSASFISVTLLEKRRRRRQIQQHVNAITSAQC